MLRYTVRPRGVITFLLVFATCCIVAVLYERNVYLIRDRTKAFQDWGISRLAPVRIEITRALCYCAYGILLFGALIYNGYGSPEYWFSDEMAGVTENMLTENRLDPKNFNYPGGLQIYLPFFMYKIASYLFGVAGAPDRSLLILVCRTTAAIFFLLGVFCADRAMALLNGRRHDLKTIILIGTSCSLIHHAHIGTVQSSMFLGIALSYLAFARCITNRTQIDFYLSAFACGVAVGAKYNTIYLGIALPILYIYSFQPSLLQFAGGMAKTACVSALGVLLFNPFILIDFSKFTTDVLEALKEGQGPAFQSSQSGVFVILDFAIYYVQAFFTDIGAEIMAGVIAAAVAVSVGLAIFRRMSFAGVSASHLRLYRLYWMAVIVSLTAAAHFILQITININQSRYYIPLGVAMVFLFSIAVDVLAIFFQSRLVLQRIPGFWTLIRVFFAGAVSVVVGLCVLNGYANVAAFAVSGKKEAQTYIDDKLRSNSDFNITEISIGLRSPTLLSKSICQGRCSVIRLSADGTAGIEIIAGGKQQYEANLDTWDEYLSQIFSRLRELNPKAIILEDSVHYWRYFIHGTQGVDYPFRLRDPNPGREVWESHFKEIGYDLTRSFPRISSLGIIDWITGGKYMTTSEGVGGTIYLYERQ
jgi:hypothetical protein